MGNNTSTMVYFDKNYSYFGEVKQIKNENQWVANGNGKYEWDGNVYMGSFKDNYFNGKGTCIFSDGALYKGMWKSNMRHGYGKINFSDGKYYEGNFKFDSANGHGKLQFDDSTYYIGEFNNNLMSGVGKLYYDNQKILYEGEWLNNAFHGFGTYYFPDGSVQYQGYWKQSLAHGRGILFDESKNVLFDGYFFEGEIYSKLENKKPSTKHKLSKIKNELEEFKNFESIVKLSKNTVEKQEETRKAFNPLLISNIKNKFSLKNNYSSPNNPININLTNKSEAFNTPVNIINPVSNVTVNNTNTNLNNNKKNNSYTTLNLLNILSDDFKNPENNLITLPNSSNYEELKSDNPLNIISENIFKEPIKSKVILNPLKVVKYN
jgi:hypothetical protein